MTVGQLKGVCMRVTKEPEERKNEIIDTAGSLFVAKGYNSVSVSDIANEIGIAKGTIFYYFKSKEELLDEVFTKFFSKIHYNAQIIAADEKLNAVEKMMKLTDINNVTGGDDKLRCFFETSPPPGNSEMILKRLVLLISSVAPVIAKIIKQGINEKSMFTKYPDEVAEIITAAEKAMFLGLFENSHNDLIKKMTAYLYVVEVILNLEEGTFDSVTERFVDLTKALGI